VNKHPAYVADPALPVLSQSQAHGTPLAALHEELADTVNLVMVEAWMVPSMPQPAFLAWIVSQAWQICPGLCHWQT